MPVEALNYSYFIRDGRRDENVDLMFNCFNQCYCEILNNTCENPEKLMKLFIEDLSFRVIASTDDTIRDMLFNWSGIKKDVIITDVHDKLNQDDVHLVERLLDSGKCVIVETAINLVEHSKYYIENYDLRFFSPGHVFLIIHHDAENYYFSEDTKHIKYDKFTPYNGRLDVGIIKKSKLHELFKYYLRCYTCTLNHKNFPLVDKKITVILKRSIENYHGEQKSNENPIQLNDNGLKIYSGRKALLKLIDIIRKKEVRLDDRVNEAGSLLFRDLFDWQFGTMVKKRKLLNIWLEEKINEEYSMEVEELIKGARESCNKWEIVENSIEIRFKRKKFLLGEDFIHQFYNVISADDIMFDRISNVLERLD